MRFGFELRISDLSLAVSDLGGATIAMIDGDDLLYFVELN